MYKNVVILSICQALSMSGASMVLIATSLVGVVLAPTSTLATLPLALQFVATMCTTIPASLLMARVGRRIGFTVGQTLGVTGAAISSYAIFAGDFWLFIVGAMFLGGHNAFWQYYRFAAADIADEAFKARAISYVLAGGVVAAILGPQLVKWTAEVTAAAFAGTYAAMIGLSFVAIFLLQFVNIPKPAHTKLSGGGRPVLEIMRTPVFMVAALSSTVGYGAMNLLMTSTPLAMIFCGFAVNDSATVMQWHALGMFAPSFFTGHIIRRYGVANVIAMGAVLQAGAVGVALSGIEFENFWGGLLLLGVGWNFMFIGGTTLLTQAYTPEERAKTQAAHDFTVFGTVAVTALLSGFIHETLGWASINLIAALPIAGAFLAVIWFRGYSARVPAE